MAQATRGSALDESIVDDENEDTQADKFIFFRMGKESYGIGIRHLIEIIELQKISAVPDMPNYVKGVVNLRGKVIPIIDIRLRFGLEERPYDDRTCILVTEIDRVRIGFIVDSVEEVLEITAANIEPPPKFKSASGGEGYISGLGKAGGEVKILLDIEKIIRDDDLSVLAEGSKAMGAA